MPDSSMLLKARMILKLVPLLVLITLVQPAIAFQIRRVVDRTRGLSSDYVVT